MQLVGFLLSLLAATTLLLYAVRQVQLGIERSHGAALERLLGRRLDAPRAAATGSLLALALQSATAVALLVTRFGARGTLAAPLAVAALLGAELGSALVVQLLSLPVDALMPLLITVGGTLHLEAKGSRARQYGRVALGIGLVLLALALLRETAAPVAEMPLLPAIARALGTDPAGALLIGAALAFLMHSSVAAVLLAAALVGTGALPFATGLALVLGANLGGALIPVWLTRAEPRAARRPVLVNAALRGVWALLALGLLMLPASRALPALADGDAARLVLAHLAFNATLLLFLPLAAPLCRLAARLLPDPPASASEAEPPSALDDDVLENPPMALACLHREVLRMAQLVEGMVRPVMDHCERGDAEAIARVRAADAALAAR